MGRKKRKKKGRKKERCVCMRERNEIDREVER